MTQRNQSQDMSPTEIRIKMIQHGVTQAGIARSIGVSPSMVNRVIDGLAISDRVRRGVAEAIQTDVKRIWPSTYIYGGGPKQPGRPKAALSTASVN